MRIPLLAATLAFGSFARLAFAAGTPSVEGTLPRNLSEGVVNFDVTVPNISVDENNTASTLAFEKMFKIFLTDVSSSEALTFTQDAAQAATVKIFATERSANSKDPDGTGFKYIYRVQLREVQAGYIKEKFTSGKMKLTVQFFAKEGGSPAELKDKVIEQVVYVINAAPDFEAGAPVVGSHKSLRISFQSKSAVAVEPAAQGQKEPTSVNAYVVDLSSVTTATLPAKKFSATAGADTDASCTFTAPASGSGACVTCEAGVYIDDSKIGTVPGFALFSASAKDGGVTATGLENEKRYAVFLQYEPDGLQVSQCLPGQPSPNFTLTELNGEGEGEVVDFRCFIATATYGSAEHEDVRAFRKFRDSVLMTSSIGQAMVELYYRLSPPVAGFIDEHPAIKPYLRAVLEIPAELLRWTQEED